MQRQLSYTDVLLDRPHDCAGCPRRIAAGRLAIRDERGTFHPSCYADSLCIQAERSAARRTEAEARRR